MRNESKYVQYVYHFNYPINSIDVRLIDDKQFQLIKELYHFYKKPNDSELSPDQITKHATWLNMAQAERILNEHFPEELI